VLCIGVSNGHINIYHCRYKFRKTGFYRVKGLTGNYDDPMTDKFLEFDSSSNISTEDIKKNPLFGEEGF